MTALETMVKMVFDRWNTQTENFDKALASLTDEQLQKEISAGKNRGIYILGHLIAIHDHMNPLLGFGDKVYPELIHPFIDSPDKATAEIPSPQALRAFWKQQKEDLRQKFSRLEASDWFEPHTTVSAEDFAQEPHRNKLNVIVTRTSHLSYHLGQFILLK